MSTCQFQTQYATLASQRKPIDNLTLTTFVKGSYNTFDTGIVSDASLLPGAVGQFDLFVPQGFGAFIGYSYVIDWEEYQ